MAIVQEYCVIESATSRPAGGSKFSGRLNPGGGSTDYFDSSALERRRGISLGDFQSDSLHLLVYRAVGSENYMASQCVRLTRKIGDLPTSFFHKQNPGGSVPFLQAEFPKAVEASRRDTSEIKGGRSIAAHAV